MSGIVRAQIPEKLLPFFTTPKRYKIAYGGRGGAKSVTLADLLLHGVQTAGWKVGCFREFQNSLEDSVHSLLQAEIDRLSIPGFKTQNTRIVHPRSGGLFRFKGLARNPGSVQSMQGFDRFWGEEAQYISQESLKLLTPTLREDDAEFLFSLNPMSSADPISQRFLEPFRDKLDRDGFYEDDLHLIIKINYKDNPWFPKGLNDDRLYDLANLPRNLYDHIWNGEYNDEVEGSIILPEWFDACVDAHKRLGFEPLGKKVASHDPSDEGADDKSFIVRHGSVVTRAETMSHGDSNDGILWATNEAIDERADLFVWDCDGLGVALKAQVKKALKGRGMDWAMYRGSESPDDPESFFDGDADGNEHKTRTNKQVLKNKRAQYYWKLRNRCYNTWLAVEKGKYIDPEKLISFSSEGIKHMTKLRAEMCRIPRKHNPNGLFQVMSKKEMATSRFKIPSPNLSDGVKMSLFMGKEPVNYSGHIPGTSAAARKPMI
jgi:phage terminase large subunit